MGNNTYKSASVTERTLERTKKLSARDGIPIWGIIGEAISLYSLQHPAKRPEQPEGKYPKRGRKRGAAEH